jgi:hypothetical protein
MKRILGLIAIVALMLGAFTVYAQEPEEPPYGPGMGGRGHMHGQMGGRGHMGGYGPMMGNMWDDVAELLGMEADDLWSEVRSGRSLVEIAEEQGITEEELDAAILSSREAHLDWMVENGYMTQEEADDNLEWMQENGFPMQGRGSCWRW